MIDGATSVFTSIFSKRHMWRHLSMVVVALKTVVQFFLVVGVPTFGEGGGVKPVGTKSQVCPKKFLDGSPKKCGLDLLEIYLRIPHRPKNTLPPMAPNIVRKSQEYVIVPCHCI